MNIDQPDPVFTHWSGIRVLNPHQLKRVVFSQPEVFEVPAEAAPDLTPPHRVRVTYGVWLSAAGCSEFLLSLTVFYIHTKTLQELGDLSWRPVITGDAERLTPWIEYEP